MTERFSRKPYVCLIIALFMILAGFGIVNHETQESLERIDFDLFLAIVLWTLSSILFYLFDKGIRSTTSESED